MWLVEFQNVPNRFRFSDKIFHAFLRKKSINQHCKKCIKVPQIEELLYFHPTLRFLWTCIIAELTWEEWFSISPGGSEMSGVDE